MPPHSVSEPVAIIPPFLKFVSPSRPLFSNRFFTTVFPHRRTKQHFFHKKNSRERAPFTTVFLFY
jgi:hypothetical protein